MTSVYLDLSLKERRAKNVVISGLSYSSSATEAVQQLLRSECNYSIPVVSCRWIGRPSTDRIQSIVVTLQSSDDAKHLIQSAKLLRESTDSVTRSSVYLNPDLTPSEARAAYELRCRRRERTDPLPTSLVKSYKDLLATFLSDLFNRSFSEGCVPSSQKTAYITPHLKKRGK